MKSRFSPLLPCLFGLAFLGISAPVRAAVDETRLRAAIPYPYLDLHYALSDGGNGIALGYPKPISRAYLREALETLKKTGEDGPLCLQIAKLDWDSGLGDDSHAFADKAEQIFQSQLVAHPDDPDLLSSLAEAKCLTGRLQDAVTYVTDLASRTDKWQIWVAESFVYRYAGTYYLLSKMKFARVSIADEYSEQLSSAATKFPTADELVFAENLFKTGTECCDKAVDLAPDNPKVYANRATFKCARDQMLYLAHPRPANDDASPFKIENEPTIIADYKSEAELNDADDFAKIRVSYLNCLNLLINGSQLRFDKGQYWRDMEPNKKKIVEREVNNLLILGEKSHDKIIAAEVQSMLSLIDVIRGEDKAAIACLREAVTEDPDRRTDWERLTEMLDEANDFKTLEAMTRVRLKVADTLHTRLILTIACVEAGDDKEALAQFGRLQADYGDDPRVHLLEIAMLLRRTGTPNRKAVLARVGDLLKRYQDDPRDNRRDRESFTLLTGIYEALNGKTEAARLIFTQAAKDNPKRGEARLALAALE